MSGAACRRRTKLEATAAAQRTLICSMQCKQKQRSAGCVAVRSSAHNLRLARCVSGTAARLQHSSSRAPAAAASLQLWAAQSASACHTPFCGADYVVAAGTTHEPLAQRVETAPC